MTTTTLLLAAVFVGVAGLLGVYLIPFLIIRLVVRRLSARVGGSNKPFHRSKLPDHFSREIVCPSPDLLYSVVLFDLTQAPHALHFSFTSPDTYASVSFFDLSSTNFDFANNDTIKPGDLFSILLVGPDAVNTAELAASLQGSPVAIVRSSFRSGLALLRMFISNKSELPKLIQSQRTLTVTPVSSSGLHLPAPPPSSNSKTRTTTTEKTVSNRFLLHIGCASLLLLTLGVQLSSSSLFWPALVLGVCAAPLAIYFSQSLGFFSLATPLSRGVWSFNPAVGSEESSLFTKAWVAVFGLLALRREEAIYLSASCDSQGRPLHTRFRYRVTVPKELPAKWWSMTVYDGTRYLVPNDHASYSVNSDSLSSDVRSVLLSSGAPPEQVGDASASHWISLGRSERREPFVLVLRLYRPRFAVADFLTLDLPVVERID